MKEKLSILKDSGIYLLLILTITLILTSILFILNISITKFNLIISILISSIILFFIQKDKKKFIKTIILSLIVLTISTLISTYTFDRSSDGNTYHKDAVGNLYLGWNPVYESSEKFVDKNLKIKNCDMHDYDIWKDHYAKANWILQANFYKLTDNIESGKAINFIFMYILFTISFTYFYSKIGVKSLILALVITFNPITCNQLYTFYNDQLGTSLLFILIINLLKIVDKKDNESIKLKFLYLFSTFIIITNIKFNIMGYAMIFTFVFMLYYLYQKYKDKEFLSTFKKLFISYLAVFIISFGLVGYSTYIKNFIDHGNPFFPVYGENSEDIITAQQPKDFVNKNVLEKLFIGTFSKVNNLQDSKDYSLKIPFTFTLDEFKQSMAIDTRLSGFGVFSSGLFILSIIALIIYFRKNNEREEKINILILLGINLLLVLIISESWWARYNPNNYLLIIILTYLLLKYCNKKIINYLVISLVIFNSLIILLGNTYYSFKESYKTHKIFNELESKEINISFNLGNMTGIIYNLNDFDIKYNVTDKELNNLTYYKYLNYEVINNEKE